jgi:hypothetical protein
MSPPSLALLGERATVAPRGRLNDDGRKHTAKRIFERLRDEHGFTCSFFGRDLSPQKMLSITEINGSSFGFAGGFLRT